MKYFFSLFILLTTKVFAYEAEVLVLRAPLLKKPNISSQVLQYLRKGDHLIISNKQIDEGFDPDYLQSYDRAGNVAYIPTKYIKIITNDKREYETPILASTDHDPTDYRIEEPIPSTYPFSNSDFLRLSLSGSFASNIKRSYAYNSYLSDVFYSLEGGARLFLSKRVRSDKEDRLYYGLYTSIGASNASITFENGNNSQENRSVLRFGPMLTYDAFKNDYIRLALGTGFTYNYHKSTITMQDKEITVIEQKLFTGYSFSPIISAYIQKNEVFKNIDLIAGTDVSLYLPYKQTTSGSSEVAAYWNGNEIHGDFETQASFFFGLQVKY